MNMTLHFGKLHRTLAWGQKGWLLLVHEPEPMVLLSSGKLRCSRQVGRHHFQIEDGLKRINVKYMR